MNQYAAWWCFVHPSMMRRKGPFTRAFSLLKSRLLRPSPNPARPRAAQPPHQFFFLLDFCTGLGTSVSPARNSLQCNPSSLVIGWITCSFSRDGVNDLHSSGGASHEQTAICTVDSSKSSTWVRYSSSTELYFILRNESHGAQPWASDRLF